MAEYSGFFNAHLVNDEYDRVYLAENFAKYFASFVGNGVFGGKSDELMVRQKDTPDMSVRVLPGQGWINGYWYENDDIHSLSIDVADSVRNRIDLIVLRWDNSERLIKLAITKGITGTNPSVPTLRRDADCYELKLAQIYVKAGATKITQADITDTRLDNKVCGLVHGLVEQIDTTEFGAQINSFIENFKVESNARIDSLIASINSKLSGDVATNLMMEFDKLKEKALQFKNETLDGAVDFNTITAAGIYWCDTTTGSGGANQPFGKDTGWLAVYNDGTTTSTIQKYYSASGLSAERVALPGQTLGQWGNANPYNIPGIEYLTTERWNGKRVYQKTFYLAALPNKGIASIETGTEWDKVVSIDAYALDSDDLTFYPFPVTLVNQVIPIAVISKVESDGALVITTSEDVEYLQAYATVKYTKT